MALDFRVWLHLLNVLAWGAVVDFTTGAFANRSTTPIKIFSEANQEGQLNLHPAGAAAIANLPQPRQICQHSPHTCPA